MSNIEYLILFPIVAGILLFLVPEKDKPLKGLMALCIAIITFYFSVGLYGAEVERVEITILSWQGFGIEINKQASEYMLFNIDDLNKLIILFICFFTISVIIYSITYIERSSRQPNYYAYLLISLGASCGAVLSDNLLLFLLFWGMLGITLYKLIKIYDEESAGAATKSLILIGGSDALMMLGIVIIWKIYGTLNMSELNVPTTCCLETVAFIALLIGSFTKAGAFPFHTWIPDYAKKAPAPSSAFLPASLDKLVGIYFMARIFNELFILNQWLKFLVISLGVLTIIIAVMMALIQTNYKKLLGYHAVSQVGYMVVGLGLGNALGIIGGLFHMINHALYKSGLFLAAGSIEKQTSRSNLNELGGLSKAMPVTFLTALIFALSISGIPPLNGFASKWIIYQGIIDFGREAGLANSLWIVWLSLAVIGSALTLASFIKFISGIFLGGQKEHLSNIKESNPIILIPMIVTAIICVAFGIFATNYIVPLLFKNIVGEISYIGGWSSGLISILIVVSIILGILIYAAGNFKKLRRAESFIGGDKIQENMNYPVSGFYYTIQNFRLFNAIYEKAKQKWFDIYYLSKDTGFEINKVLRKLHSGILSDYALWIIVGLIIMLLLINVV